MLVVIAIIMLLAGLILAAVNVARDRAKDLRARRDVAQLKTAFTAYYGDYNRFPDLQDSSTTNVPGVSGDVVICDNDVIRILRGREDPTGENPKKISYMDFHQNTSAFNDPWGNPYRITLDTDYDSNVEIPSGEVRQSVAAWSAGKDEKDGTDDDPRTWR